MKWFGLQQAGSGPVGSGPVRMVAAGRQQAGRNFKEVGLTVASLKDAGLTAAGRQDVGLTAAGRDAVGSGPDCSGQDLEAM